VIPDKRRQISCFIGILASAGALALAGCVQRTLTITTRPSGALVMLNDQEVGRTPVTVNFEWYGDYDVICRLEEYETLKTHTRIDAPWYQWPPFDFAAEVLWPRTIHDRHYHEFMLVPKEYPTPQELLKRADGLRAETLGEPLAQPLPEPTEQEEAPAGQPETDPEATE
jgi:hypothetical protein